MYKLQPEVYQEYIHPTYLVFCKYSEIHFLGNMVEYTFPHNILPLAHLTRCQVSHQLNQVWWWWNRSNMCWCHKDRCEDPSIKE